MFRHKPRPAMAQPNDPSIRLIPLTQGQVAIVDACHYEWVMRWRWHALYNPRTRSYYATRCGHNEEPKLIWLHRQLAGEPRGKIEVDHVNADSLDNRMQNLRVCTHQQNLANRRLRSDNTSGVLGVSRVRGKWQAEIQVGGKGIYLGWFENKDDAVAARVYAELVHFGEFAPSARDLIILPPNLFGSSLN
jgi:hypothetical protein